MLLKSIVIEEDLHMSKIKEEVLKGVIEMSDQEAIEKLHVFLQGMLAQQSIQVKNQSA